METVAVPCESGEVCRHFGHAPQFRFYRIENGTVTGNHVRLMVQGGHSAIVGMLREEGADTVICSGIGAPAVAGLAAAGIRLFPGIGGSADEAVAALAAGALPQNEPRQGQGHRHGDGCGGQHAHHHHAAGCAGHAHGHEGSCSGQHGHGHEGGCADGREHAREHAHGAGCTHGHGRSHGAGCAHGQGRDREAAGGCGHREP
ncbi:dinitrogenase iron-molybdenum cofactor [Eggerthellaceae bacterium zg-1084]|uniref:NifB/NifX family molybdenum-iron cluster-binding protein n=1 Tax=Berryella wangjianweii TaxID=2734634 RepID=UPI0015574230|nr:NifB/NifX family molybdenum-iron cluster-binding protein [Berryella wangjianweii]NPD30745.1 dinitrogenase iron-molybdenum cofactor [Berryella wangjianweii]